MRTCKEMIPGMKHTHSYLEFKAVIHRLQLIESDKDRLEGIDLQGLRRNTKDDVINGPILMIRRKGNIQLAKK